MKTITAVCRSCIWLFVLIPLAGCIPVEAPPEGLSAVPGDADQVLAQELGTVDFPISCTAEAQAEFHSGVALLHSFFFPRAMASFETVTELDPNCAMGYWGIAMTNLGIPWSPTSEQGISGGEAAVEQAMAIGAQTEREQAYLDAVAELFMDTESLDFRTRIEAYEVAMEQLALDFPEDVEAQTFYGLALNMTGLPPDETFSKQWKASEVLEPIFAAQPNHPGAAHYLIHTYDFPPIASNGLDPALVYASIAPAAPHAQHMPSHIFTRLGYWQESIDSNSVGVAANKEAMAPNHPPGTAFEGALHGTDYMVYAHLQLGQDEAALAFMDEINAIEEALGGFGSAYALAAIPARYVLERGIWEEAATLALHPPEFAWEKFPQAEALLVFAQGLGAARSDNVEAANEALTKLQALHTALVGSENSYWATQVAFQALAVEAWIALADGDQEDALRLMQEAVALEDGSRVHPVSPGPVKPMHELHGEMLLELEQPAEALQAFETSLIDDPNRFRSLYGAARSAELAGDADKAVRFYTEFVNLVATADSERPEMVQAQAFLGR